METSTKIAELIFKFRKNSLNDQEQQELHNWLESSEKNRELFNRLINKRHRKISQKDKAAEWNKIVQPNSEKPARLLHLRNWKRYTAAAAIVLLVLKIILPFNTNDIKQEQGVAIQESRGKSETVAPAITAHALRLNSDFPLLLLPSGSVIKLDEKTCGPIARIDNIEIKNINGQVEFDSIPGYSTNFIQPFIGFSENILSTIVTPKGIKYNVKLWEGTKINLNTCSVLQFPTKFNESGRNVKLSGEAFFNVTTQYSHAGKVPFYVHFNKAKVNVLGTKFNIMAFPDEKIAKVTLEEGKVEISKNSSKRLLKPRQQVQLLNDSLMNPKDVDIKVATAWINGAIIAKSASVEEVMRQICRLYNVEVKYESKPTGHVDIHILPNTSLVEAMDIIKGIGIAKYRIEAKTVIITK